MKRVLVTGGAGFIGSNAVDFFIKRGDRVLVVDNLLSGRREYVHPRATFVKLDIRSKRLREVFRRFRPHAVTHFAAQRFFLIGEKDPMFDADVNVLGTLNVLLNSAEVKTRALVFASTAALYDDDAPLPVSEKSPPNPPFAYGVSKAAGELYLRYFRDRRGLRTVSLRFPNPYGPRQEASGHAGTISKFSVDALRGQPIYVHGDGRATRDFLYVGDLAEAVGKAVDRPVSGTFNISTGKQITINELARLVVKVTGTSSRIIHDAPVKGERRKNALDARLARRVLGWKPHTSLLEGLKQTVPWFARYGERGYR